MDAINSCSFCGRPNSARVIDRYACQLCLSVISQLGDLYAFEDWVDSLIRRRLDTIRAVDEMFREMNIVIPRPYDIERMQ